MRVRDFLRDLKAEYDRDQLGDIAAMMAYYTIFALFPMLVFVVTTALLVVPPTALGEATEMATRAMPGQVAALIQREIGQMQAAAGGGLAIGSALLALWGASRGSVSLGRALNRVYGLDETRPWWRLQLTGVLLTLAVTALLIAALALLVVGPVVGHYLMDRFGLGGAFEAFWGIGRWGLAALLLMLIWGLLYRYLPDTEVPLRVFTPGSAVAVIGWIAVSLLFAVYVGNFGSYEETYGALGAAMVFLTWLWLSNLVMLAGAEINQVLGWTGARAEPDAARSRDGQGRPAHGSHAG